MEGELENVLQMLQPTERVYALAEAIFMDAWNERGAHIANDTEAVNKELALLNEKCSKLADKIMAANNAQVEQVYEQKLTEIKSREAKLLEQLEGYTHGVTFGTAWEAMHAYIKSPYKIWTSDDLWDQRTVLQVVFDGDLSYHFELGLGTANLSPVYAIFQQIAASDSQNVEMAGIEPASNKNSKPCSTGVDRLRNSEGRGETDKIRTS